MVAIAAEILGGEFPVAGDYPFVHPSDHFDTPLATIEEGIQIPGHVPEILQERRRCRIEGGKQQPLIAVQLRHRDQAPALLFQLSIVSLFEVWNTHQLPVVTIGPAMIGTGEGSGIARIGPAQPIAPIPANLEKGVDCALAVPHHQDRVLAHRRAEEVPRLGDLAFMAQKQPAAGKDLRQLLLIDLWLDKDAPADQAALGIHQTPCVRHHTTPPYAVLAVAQKWTPWRTGVALGSSPAREPGRLWAVGVTRSTIGWTCRDDVH